MPGQPPGWRIGRPQLPDGADRLMYVPVALHQIPMNNFQNLDAYWRAAIYLSVGQIYLRRNGSCEPQVNNGR